MRPHIDPEPYVKQGYPIEQWESLSNTDAVVVTILDEYGITRKYLFKSHAEFLRLMDKYGRKRDYNGAGTALEFDTRRNHEQGPRSRLP